MASTPLISTADLATRLSDPLLRIIDCRFDLGDPEAGMRAWQQSRIPHARYAHLNQDLSDLSQQHVHGRHPLPSMASLAASLSRLDITPRTPVVAYDQDSGAYAARLWWLLRATGFANAKVLDGGFAAWQRVGLPVEAGTPPRTAASRLPDRIVLPETTWVSADVLKQGLTDGTLTLVDARAAPRFRGEVEPIDPIAGHIPGALNRPFMDNLTATGVFKEPGVLRAEFSQLLRGKSAGAVVHMCGSGVTACHNRLAMDHAGLRGSRLYPDSWSGWITDQSRPVVQGA